MLFLILPLAMLVVTRRKCAARLAVRGVAIGQSGISALLLALLVALVSTGLMLALALPMAIASARRSSLIRGRGALLGIAAISRMVDWHRVVHNLINPIANPFTLALPVTALGQCS